MLMYAVSISDKMASTVLGSKYVGLDLLLEIDFYTEQCAKSIKMQMLFGSRIHI